MATVGGVFAPFWGKTAQQFLFVSFLFIFLIKSKITVTL